MSPVSESENSDEYKVGVRDILSAPLIGKTLVGVFGELLGLGSVVKDQLVRLRELPAKSAACELMLTV
ncbi:hypothetical protein FJZ31_08100 [Candidatus Poribacteria bacterium]|nr:hypothetical protein [Candidatus Poribacteria bacterium]